MTKKNTARYQAFLALGLVLLVLGIALTVPPVELSLLPQERPLLTVGASSFTLGDLFLVVATIGACVDIASLFFMFRKR